MSNIVLIPIKIRGTSLKTWPFFSLIHEWMLFEFSRNPFMIVHKAERIGDKFSCNSDLFLDDCEVTFMKVEVAVHDGNFRLDCVITEMGFEKDCCHTRFYF